MLAAAWGSALVLAALREECAVALACCAARSACLALKAASRSAIRTESSASGKGSMGFSIEADLLGVAASVFSVAATREAGDEAEAEASVFPAA